MAANAMTDTHVVSALKTKRIQVASQIEAPTGPATAGHNRPRPCRGGATAVDPEVDLAALSPREVTPIPYDTKGDTGRIILETLRTSLRPLSAAQVNEAVMRARALDTNDRALCRVMMRRTNANLKHWAER
jgi:hypothetical protein